MAAIQIFMSTCVLTCFVAAALTVWALRHARQIVEDLENIREDLSRTSFEKRPRA